MIFQQQTLLRFSSQKQTMINGSMTWSSLSLIIIWLGLMSTSNRWIVNLQKRRDRSPFLNQHMISESQLLLNLNLKLKVIFLWSKGLNLQHTEETFLLLHHLPYLNRLLKPSPQRCHLKKRVLLLLQLSSLQSIQALSNLQMTLRILRLSRFTETKQCISLQVVMDHLKEHSQL